MNGKDVGGRTLYVGRAQKKQERQNELREKYERLKIHRINSYQGVNLYVKNLDKTIDDELLRKEFAPFGNITSACVMCDESGHSKGFGFVCFSNSEEAAKAVTDMNGRVVVHKPLYVALAQSREERKLALQAQHMGRMSIMRIQDHQVAQMLQPNASGFFVPTMPQNQQGFYPSQIPQLVQPRPRWQSPAGMRPQNSFQAVQGGAQVWRTRPTGQVQSVSNGLLITDQQTAGSAPVHGMAANNPGRPVNTMPGAQGHRPSYKYVPSVHNQPQPPMQAIPASQPVEEVTVRRGRHSKEQTKSESLERCGIIHISDDDGDSYSGDDASSDDVASSNDDDDNYRGARAGSHKMMYGNFRAAQKKSLTNRNDNQVAGASSVNTFRNATSDVAAHVGRNLRSANESMKSSGAVCNEFPCRMLPFALNSQGVPTNWLHSSPEDASLYKIFELKEADFEYQVIRSELDLAQLKVTRIERVQNHVLLDTYKHQMTHLSNHRPPGYQFNERYLYHGTAAEKEQICEEGLDMRLSRMGRFGKGIYFSDNPQKCITYTEAVDDSGQLFLLKCRVLLGDMKVYPPGQSESSLKREPKKEIPGDSWKYYDSVKGQPKDYNEYVVYQNSRVLVEYVVYIEDPGIGIVPFEGDLINFEEESKPTSRSNRTMSVGSFKGRSSSPYRHRKSQSSSVSSQGSNCGSCSSEELHPELQEIDSVILSEGPRQSTRDVSSVRKANYKDVRSQPHSMWSENLVATSFENENNENTVPSAPLRRNHRGSRDVHSTEPEPVIAKPPVAGRKKVVKKKASVVEIISPGDHSGKVVGKKIPKKKRGSSTAADSFSS